MTGAFKTLARPGDTAELFRRLTQLRPESVRHWGRMSAHQMVCHLRDAFLMGTDSKPVSYLTGLHRRTLIKWISLYVPLKWPPGIATRPEIDQMIGGTRPNDFDADLAALEALIEVIVSRPRFFDGRRHPIFGPLSDAGWKRWGYLHVDHHLRQFGV